MKLTREMIEQTKSVRSAEEFLEIVKAGGVELTADEAKAYFEQMHSAELDDDLLDGVAGGWVIQDESQEPTYERFGKSSRSQCG